MTDLNVIGKVLYTKYARIYEIVGKTYVKNKEGIFYLANDEYPKPVNENFFGCLIISEEEVKDMLNNYDEYKAKYLRLMAEQKEWDRKEREREEREAKEKAERENLYGFDDGKTPMQRGKLLKTLLKEFMYYDYKEDGTRTVKTQSRKDFVIHQLKKGYKPSHEKNVKMYSKRAECGYKLIPNYYTLKLNNSSWDITKTEYDFANYVKEKGIA